MKTPYTSMDGGGDVSNPNFWCSKVRKHSIEDKMHTPITDILTEMTSLTKITSHPKETLKRPKYTEEKRNSSLSNYT